MKFPTRIYYTETDKALMRDWRQKYKPEMQDRGRTAVYENRGSTAVLYPSSL